MSVPFILSLRREKPGVGSILALFVVLLTALACGDESGRRRPGDDVSVDTLEPDTTEPEDTVGPPIDVEDPRDTHPPDAEVVPDATPTPDTEDEPSRFRIVLEEPSQDAPLVLLDQEGDRLHFTVNPEFLGAESYLWLLNGTELAGETDETLVLDVADLPLGVNRVTTVVVTDDGWAHSGEITFVVSSV